MVSVRSLTCGVGDDRAEHLDKDEDEEAEDVSDFVECEAEVEGDDSGMRSVVNVDDVGSA